MLDDQFETNQAFFAALQSLIDAWCERRALPVLAAILPAYVSFNGMTDGWGEMLFALKKIAAFERGNLTPAELATVDNLRRAAERAIDRRT